MANAKTSLFLVQFPAGVRVFQVDDFPQGASRSRKGSIHVKPGTQKLTQSEVEHLKSKYPECKVRVLRKMAPKPEPNSTPEKQPKKRGGSKPKAASKPVESPKSDDEKPSRS